MSEDLNEAVLEESEPEDVTGEHPEQLEVDPFAELAAERDQITDALTRLQADFENFRRRSNRELSEASSRGASAVVLSLLPVLDALDLAAAHLGESAEASAEGLALVQARSLLLDSLAKQGLERLDGAPVVFDPQIHDAVMHAEGEGEPTVVEVMRAGYRLGELVIRPAMVRVEG